MRKMISYVIYTYIYTGSYDFAIIKSLCITRDSVGI